MPPLSSPGSPTSRYWPPFADLPRDRGRPFVLSHGRGSLVYDRTGNEYVDATASLWYVLVGHGRTELADAARAQMATLAAYYTHGDYANEPALRLAERLSDLAPVDDGLVLLSSGGGDAIDTAAKLARRYWQVVGQPARTVLLHREFGYHGMQGLGTGLSGVAALRDGYGNGLFPAYEPLPANDWQALERRIHEVGPHRVAAFFVEPVIGAGGVHPPAPGYLEAVQRLCDEHRILLVADEVVTGFGRLGRWFGSEVYDLAPDLVCFAKGVTSGYVQLGGVIASRRVWEPISAGGTSAMFRHGYTYAGHPTACAVAAANLDIIEREGLVERAATLAAPFSAAIASLATTDEVAEVRSAGLMGGVELDTDSFGSDLPERVVLRARELGVLVRRTFPGTIQISPPLIVTQREIDRIVTVLAQAILECAGDRSLGTR